MSDILDGLFQMRVAFMKAGLKAPDVVLLNDTDQGRKFFMEMMQTDKALILEHNAPMPDDLPEGVTAIRRNQYETIIEHPDGSAWAEVSLMGLKVRWPATMIAERQGRGFKFAAV